MLYLKVLALHCAVKDSDSAGGGGSSNLAPPVEPTEVKAALVRTHVSV